MINKTADKKNTALRLIENTLHNTAKMLLALFLLQERLSTILLTNCTALVDSYNGYAQITLAITNMAHGIKSKTTLMAFLKETRND